MKTTLSQLGTGKTAAYLLPILHNVLRRTGNRETSSLILVPTKELALQVTKVAQSLAAFCDVRVQNLASKESEVVQRAKLADLPQIVVATPARAAANMNNGALSLKSLAHLVVDEGDLVMGYGFKEDLDYISQNIPKGVQIFLMSATLNTDVDAVKGLFCRDPVLLDLGALEKDSQQVKQYVSTYIPRLSETPPWLTSRSTYPISYPFANSLTIPSLSVKCAEEEKFLLAYALFKLDLIKGKTIVFV